MTRNQWIIVGGMAAMLFILLCVVAAVAFGSLRRAQYEAAMASLPSATPLPTFQLPPTWTPVPLSTPTAVPIGAARPTPRTDVTRAGTPGPIENALTRSRSVKAFRLDMDMSFKGDLSMFPANPAPNGELSILNMIGEMNGADSHLVMKGFVSLFFGTDWNRGIEMMNVGGKSYLHGPLALLGAVDDRWYVSTGAASTTPLGTDSFLNGFHGESADWSGFKKQAAESLDNRRCDVYLADKATTLRLFQSFDTAAIPATDLDQVDNAETRMWVCDDGFLHQVRMVIDGREASRTTPMTLSVRLHLFDQNGNIKITAPANAVPFQFKNWSLPTRTPTPVKRWMN